jgi:hypothetical protein
LAVARQVGLHAAHVALLTLLLADQSWAEAELDTSFVTHFKNDSPPQKLDPQLTSALNSEEASTAPGILHFVYLVLKFDKTRQGANLFTLLHLIREHIEAFLALPLGIRALVPVDFSRDITAQIDELLRKSHEELREWITAVKPTPPPVQLPLGLRGSARLTKEGWSECVRLAPELALRLWSEASPQFLKFSIDPPALIELARRLVEVPRVLIQQPLLVGRLFAQLGC